ncbi:sensor histidine kinase [Clostridium sp. CX1]|uniref:histidine kinase n=1 Tax=Clostridium tanneri TaxID=3037988 RepID=A0ABU4JYQ0_9CLOT|nr:MULTISPECIES: sensor histidine kinase [unclassified Clostridium]MCT8975282.1 sensor histidine kinase [Clostridium sp. CX1]MDW8803024.1 sensor histidine kinase [Clostridium sp. A1-XYC3]
MINFLIAIVIIVPIILFLTKIHMKNKDISFIISSLSKVSFESVNDRIRLVTGDKIIKSLCLEINSFISRFYTLKVSETESKEAMKKMISNISHDLRTPMTVMLGYIDQLNYNSLLTEKEKKEYLTKLEKKMYETITLMNEFFSLSKLESGDEVINIVKLNISEIAKKSILSFYETLETNKINVEIDIPEKDIWALGNEEAITRVLNNLITNSIKYGSDGKVIGIKLYEENDLVWIEQWDKGKGISESEKNKVFERLYTLDESRNKDYQGSGLGLTIVQTLINKMNGEIYLKSVPYERTVFKFYLKKQ